ncbi:hypothetical protein N7540_003492 [Penicillium herquei]|nr:hypothetical protein N7540_003492 [Penicillium herquei]
MLQGEVVYSEFIIIGAGYLESTWPVNIKETWSYRLTYVIYDCAAEILGVLYSLSWFTSTSFTRPFPAPCTLYSTRYWLTSNSLGSPTKYRTEQGYKPNIQKQERFIHEAKILISAVGGYTNLKVPQITGLEKFRGPVIHTAQWERDYDLKGLNVAVISNRYYDLRCKSRMVDNDYISSLHNRKIKLVKDAIGTVGPKSMTTIPGHNLGEIGAFQIVATNGFPNMFCLLGPNSGSGHTSALFSMEWLVDLSNEIKHVKMKAYFSAVNHMIDLVSPVPQ